MKSGSWVYLLLGIWLLVSPAVLHVGGVLMRNDIAFGVVAIVVAIWSIVARPQSHAPAWIGLAVGFWVFSAPWGLGVVAGSVTLANNALCGALMMIFAIVRTQSEPLSSRMTT